MGRRYTILTKRTAAAFTVLACAALAAPAEAQSSRSLLDWRRIGNSSQLLGLPSPAGGAADRVWFSQDGRILVRLSNGRVYGTADLEQWQSDSAQPPAFPAAPEGAVAPEVSARLVPANSNRTVLYASGRNAWRSEDGGLNWHNLTQYRAQSLLGSDVKDLAVDPTDDQRLVAATATGVWYSVDAGLSWQGLNEALPNLPVRRILAAPSGSRGVRIAVDSGTEPAHRDLEWLPGQNAGWLPVKESSSTIETELKRSLSTSLNATITTASAYGDAIYAGAADGRLWSSLDAGRSWRVFPALPGSGAVERIWLDPADRSFALAALSSAGAGPRVLRTLNGGGFWDDLSANLAEGPAYGVTAERSTGALYLATARGIFYTMADLRAPAMPTGWQPLSAGLPDAAVRDVRLDDDGNLLIAAVDGYGVYAALAPHRLRQPRVVHTFDYGQRAAAPGALLSVLGARVGTASANRTSVPVLSSNEAESQIQVPYEVTGDSLQLVLNAAQGPVVFGLPLHSTAPAVLIDRDGTPVLIDADSGVQLDAMHPARPGMRVQILMSGLGRVQPDWPTGMAAPLEDAPRVMARVRATLDGAPLEVVRATLAPGYIGYYLVEVQLPEFVDTGSSELALEAGGKASNRVRLYVAQ
ncbi:MAG: hypothetical protein J0H49_21390 [Acidobacteria bacterium]|nr:hypothetical protein [Acidobacteriota bacterium]